MSSPKERSGGDVEHGIIVIKRKAHHAVHAGDLSTSHAGMDYPDQHRQARQRQQDVVQSFHRPCQFDAPEQRNKSESRVACLVCAGEVSRWRGGRLLVAKKCVMLENFIACIFLAREF